MTTIAPLDSTPPLSPLTTVRTVSSNDASPVVRGRASAATSASTVGGSFATSIDPALGITVLKFFSSAGDLTQSFPSQKQLASYQLYGLDSGSTSASTDKGDGTTAAAAA